MLDLKRQRLVAGLAEPVGLQVPDLRDDRFGQGVLRGESCGLPRRSISPKPGGGALGPYHYAVLSGGVRLKFNLTPLDSNVARPPM